MIIHFKISKELYTAGVSLFVLGFGECLLVLHAFCEGLTFQPSLLGAGSVSTHSLSHLHHFLTISSLSFVDP